VGSSSPFSSDSVSIYRSDYREEKENYGSYNYQGLKVSTNGSEIRTDDDDVDNDADERRERVLEDDEEYSLPSLRLCLLAAEDIINRATVHNDIVVHLRGSYIHFLLISFPLCDVCQDSNDEDDDNDDEYTNISFTFASLSLSIHILHILITTLHRPFYRLVCNSIFQSTRIRR
jgi:hypothetical protein